MVLPLRKMLNAGRPNWRQVTSFRFAISPRRPHIFWVAINGDATPAGHPNKISPPMGEPEEKSMPPNLETFISGEYLPDSIDVYVTSSHKICMPRLNSGLWERFIERYPVRFVRQYPPRIPADTGMFKTIVIARSDAWMRIRMVISR